ncbi:hypothetical protein CHLRE_16g670000v5 [Chlamydomonas reinhardtii]|uniref:Uncharacterized protein n=1 Tax=Chlamydomonas reinhardtii TaxID=3055 RepID=A0A2K3CUB2_CHLRE|nr:uncharacterized protein CHLRE_16g670000v5 [Chlamydomonas reinhardtii]PNW71862.1 hypothetical protein CHLRE_16g670000v5 [Chlamydomonas reinhardtii]
MVDIAYDPVAASTGWTTAGYYSSLLVGGGDDAAAAGCGGSMAPMPMAKLPAALPAALLPPVVGGQAVVGPSGAVATAGAQQPTAAAVRSAVEQLLLQVVIQRMCANLGVMREEDIQYIQEHMRKAASGPQQPVPKQQRPRSGGYCPSKGDGPMALPVVAAAAVLQQTLLVLAEVDAACAEVAAAFGDPAREAAALEKAMARVSDAMFAAVEAMRVRDRHAAQAAKGTSGAAATAGCIIAAASQPMAVGKENKLQQQRAKQAAPAHPVPSVASAAMASAAAAAAGQQPQDCKPAAAVGSKRSRGAEGAAFGPAAERQEGGDGVPPAAKRQAVARHATTAATAAAPGPAAAVSAAAAPTFIQQLQMLQAIKAMQACAAFARARGGLAPPVAAAVPAQPHSQQQRQQQQQQQQQHKQLHHHHHHHHQQQQLLQQAAPAKAAAAQVLMPLQPWQVEAQRWLAKLQ